MNIISVIFPLLAVGLVGFFCAKYQWFARNQIDTLSKFTFYIAIPAFLFQRLINADLTQMDLSVYAAFYLPVLFVYFFASLVNYYFHQHHHHNIAASASYALGTSYSNNVIVGLPLLFAMFGEQVLPTIFLIVSLHSAMLFGLTAVLASKAGDLSWQQLLKQLFFNPLILAILSGFTLNLVGVVLPTILNQSLLLLGQPAITLALFLLGSSMAYYQVKAQIKFVSFATVLKLVVLPLLVYLWVSTFFSFDHMTTVTLVMLSACPTGVNAYLEAKQQGFHQDTVAGSVVTTTILAIISMPLWLYFLTS